MRATIIEHVSAFTPIGCSAMQTAMCARAAAFEPRTVSLEDKRSQEIGMCLVGGLGRAQGYERMVELGAGALAEVVAALEPGPSAFVVAVPAAGRPDDDPRFRGELARDVARRAGLALDEQRVAVVRADQAGLGHALKTALGWLEGGAQRVVVGGVDSYFHPDVLAWLDEACRLHALGAEDGFVPGEAAAFFVLSQRKDARGPRLVDVQVGHDPSAQKAPPSGTPPDTATTMTELLHRLVANAGAASWAMVDDNGERHRRRWWLLAAARETLAPEAEVLAIPRVMGDVGAATGAVSVAIAHSLWRAGVAPGPRCLVALHGEDGERSAFQMEQRA